MMRNLLLYCLEIILLRLLVWQVSMEQTNANGSSDNTKSDASNGNVIHVTDAHAVTVCDNHCDCRVVHYRVLRCDKPNTLTHLKWAMKMDNITELYIEQQMGLTHLSADDLEPFIRLTKLSIRESGLKYVIGDLFRNNPAVRYIDFQNNQLDTLSYKFIDSVFVEEIYLQNNHFECNCSAYWIHRMMSVDDMRHRLGHDLKNIKCNNGNTVSESSFNTSTCDPASAIVTPSAGVTVEVGGDATMTCEGTGIPTPKVFWNITGLLSDVSITSSDDGLRHILKIRNARPLDNGWVTCIAENDARRNKLTVPLGVRAAPIIIDVHLDHEDIVYDCIEYTLTGNPAPNITWLRNDAPLSDDGGIIEHNPRIKSSLPPKDTGRDYEQGCLSFKMFTLPNNAMYTLVAANEYGSVNQSIRYEQEWPPGKDLDIPGPPRGGFGLGSFGGGTPFKKWPGSHATTRKPVEDDDADTSAHTWVSIVVIACVLLLVVTALLYRRYRGDLGLRKCRVIPSRGRSGVQRSRENMPLTSNQMVENPNYSPNAETPFSYVEIRHIRAEFISCVEQLGEGAFGRVYLGQCDNMPKEGETVMVAIKMLKDISDDAKKDFEREAGMLTTIEHLNIVTFFGICIEQENYMMIFEYMENGDLNNYLRKHGPDAAVFSKCTRPEPMLTEIQLLYIIHQIANGMTYLAQQHFVHRDLATRNCLVGPRLLIKIGDFGMSRDVYSTDYYKVGGSALLPVRWMPPESLLYRTFTVESDVWSLGVVMWEVFTFGRQPWYQMSNNEVIQCITNGHLLDIPTSCPEEVSKIMMGCWKRQPHERMPIKVIYSHLERLCLSDPGYVDLLS